MGVTRKNIRCCRPFPDSLLRQPNLMNSWEREHGKITRTLLIRYKLQRKTNQTYKPVSLAFLPPPSKLLLLLWAPLHKKYWTGFQETWWKGGNLAEQEPIRFWHGSGQRGRSRNVLKSLFLILPFFKKYFHQFPKGLIHGSWSEKSFRCGLMTVGLIVWTTRSRATVLLLKAYSSIWYVPTRLCYL